MLRKVVMGLGHSWRLITMRLSVNSHNEKGAEKAIFVSASFFFHSESRKKILGNKAILPLFFVKTCDDLSSNQDRVSLGNHITYTPSPEDSVNKNYF